jgi:electron transfer flavoprotein alpha subunit
MTTDKFPKRSPGSVLLLAATDAKGRLRAVDRRVARAASALARQRGKPLASLVFTTHPDVAASIAAPELASIGAGSITLVSTDKVPDPKVAPQVWCRLLMDQWSPEWSTFSIVLAGVWAEPALARFGPKQAELIFRVSGLSPGASTPLIRCSRCEGKVDAFRELPQDNPRPIWISAIDSVESTLPPLGEVLQPQVLHLPVKLSHLPSRKELQDILQQVRDHAGAERLSEADFILDIGYGIGSADGFEEIVVPLQKLLQEIGVPQVTLGGSRKVTEELRILSTSQQIGQTGQSVNPVILLAIGISGAPQHLNYIGQRATILAFNRDPEAPIMTLNLRQPQPKVFPIVGDLFQTVPAFMEALRAHLRAEAETSEPVLVP